jgi:hypothetical protein
MANEGNAKLPQLSRDVTELSRAIEQLALLVRMRFVLDSKKVKAFNASADEPEPIRSGSASEGGVTSSRK